MESLGNREIFSRNLRALMDRHGKDRGQICADLGFKYTTFTDWCNGKKYPRIDKIEMLARYFGVKKSDLIEDSSISHDSRTDDARIIERNPRVVSSKELKFALWGDTDISDEDLEDVRRYAAFLAERKKKQ